MKLIKILTNTKGKKHTTIGWDDGGNIGKTKLILTEIFPSVHET